MVASVALAQGTYTQIDYPGAAQTQTLGINSTGDVVGGYQDSSGILHGFLLSAGTYTTVDYAGAVQTELVGLNDVGQTVGWASLDGVASFGFLYDTQTGIFTNISYPGAGDTYAYCINNAGVIAGYFQSSLPQGFELIGTDYIKVSPFGAGVQSYLFGVTTSGELAGVAFPRRKYDNFLLTQGKYRNISVPGFLPTVQGIASTSHAIVGSYEPKRGNPIGFLLQGSTFTKLSFPGSMQTGAFGVNDAGVVSGWFWDATGNYEHGFTWVP